MDVGHIALALSSACVVVSILGFVIGDLRKDDRVLKIAKYSVVSTCAFLSASVFVLVYYLVSRSFRFEYVFLHTDKSLSLLYTISALWAGSSGSLLLWAWFLSIFLVGVVLKEKDDALTHHAISISMSTELFLIAILLTLLNPFNKLAWTPPDGMGLNPLLQDFGMVIHPPTLFVGYAGLVIPFAFALSGLLVNSERWVYRVRAWTLFSWLFLGLGVLIGAWWAYTVLGWGGYWAWDPVENSSLLPWLTSTAFLHSIMIQQARRGMKLWNMLLSILTFEFVIFATFLTRSGVIASVHAFAESPLGMYFAGYMVVVLGFSSYLIATKYSQIKSKDIFESAISKETTFLINNLLLVVSSLAIWWGTIFPFVYEAVKGTKISVGPVFYDQTQAPILVLLLVFMGLCIAMPWRKGSLEDLKQSFKYPLIGAFTSAAIVFLLGYTESYVLVVIFSLAFALAVTVQEYCIDCVRFRRTFKTGLETIVKVVLKRRRRYGGYIVHIAMILIALGVVGSQMYDTKSELTLEQGQSVSIGKYSFFLAKNNFRVEEDKRVWSVELNVYDGEKYVGTLEPKIAQYYKGRQIITSVDVLSTITEDVYVIPKRVGADVASLEIRFIPLVSLIWIGGGVMIAGTFIALIPRLKRRVAEGG